MNILKFNYSRFFLDLFFPNFCLGCKEIDQILCLDCLNCLKKSTIYNDFEVGDFAIKSFNSQLDSLYTIFDYENVMIHKILHEYKYNLIRDFAGIIYELYSLLLREIYINYDLFIVIPSHIKKIKKRGFDHLQSIFESKKSIVKISKGVIVKQKDTKAQMKLNKEQRLKNLKGVFAIEKTDLEGKSILLLDDVATTGSTLNQVAGLLKKNGAKSVDALVLARQFK